MSRLIGICFAIGMVAVVFSQVLFSSNDFIDLDFNDLMRILLRHRTLERHQPTEYFISQGIEYDSRLTKFSWKNCGKASDPLNITAFDITPDPIKLPGSIQFSLTGAIEDVLASPIKMDVTMKKKIGVIWVTIPCIDNVGTCTYDDVCALLTKLKHCPSEVTKAGFNCTCPFPKKAINVPPSTINITGGQQVPEGDYMIQADLSRSAGHVGCLQIYLSIVH